jgi:serine phosphatase RsbU (regulator of sigma subunit)
MLVEVVRVERSRATVAREGVAILLAGMAVLAVFIVLQLLVSFRVVPAVAGFNEVYVFGVLASVLTMSLFLARTFARTSLHLERRLAEVESLTAQVLDQERAAHANELRQRLLEAENARKSGELEAGRALQLSMLPPALPEVEGLELAVAMSTASEVGGDYYDFRRAPDGSLVVAVGDATGHGVAAGILVTAVKALFSTLGGNTGLAPMLAECDRVLRGMNLKHLHMCLSVARIGARSVTVCLAAMPPLLVWRAGSGRVEELGAGGLPLGGGLSPVYEEQSAALGPGDTLLFATDGFPELLDPEGKPFGFDGAAEALRAAGGAPAREIVERLTAAAATWRRGREQADDITFVVVRVKP